MSKYVTVSAKIPKELKEKLRKLNVNISKFVRNAIQQEIRRREEKKLRTLAEEVSQSLRKIPPQGITKTIREMREEQ